MTHDPVQQALAELDSGDLARRIDALRQLRAQQDARIAPRLMALLNDADNDVRRLTAETLGRNGDSGAVRALSDALYDDHAAVRGAAADALGLIADRAAVPALIDALYDEDINVRFAAARALGLIADPRAIVDLIFLLDNADIPLAMIAAWALYKIGTPESLSAIQHLQDEDGTYHFEVPKPGQPESAAPSAPSMQPPPRASDDLSESSPRISTDIHRPIPPAKAEESSIVSPEEYARQQLEQPAEVAPTEPQSLANKFRQAEASVRALRQQFQQRRITREQFEADLYLLMVLDDNYVWWMIGVESDRWYRYDEGKWVPATPPALADAEGDDSDRAVPTSPATDPSVPARVPVSDPDHTVPGTGSIYLDSDLTADTGSAAMVGGATEPSPPSPTYTGESLPAPAKEADETLRHIPPDRLHELVDEEAPGESAKEAEAATEPVQFSSYYPREVAPNVWNPLRAYVFKPSAADAVSADAAQELGALLPSYREVERPAQVSIAEGALITATPELSGFQFNPPSAQVAFYEDWQRFDFKLRAVDAPLEQASNGRITFTVEGVIVADIPLAIYVGETVGATTAPTSGSRPIYQSIFCSYSHKDTQIVERVERAYKALGMTFLRDVVALRSGQDWNAELLRLIESADIFQLFWSRAAAESQAVRKEWLHALSLRRQASAFIRPVYWEQPMPPPAPELAAIHFAYEPELDQA